MVVTPASKSVALRTLVLAGIVVVAMAVVAVLQHRGDGDRAPRVAFTGNHVFSVGELRDALAADPLTDGDLERGALVLAAYYWDRGYAQARVGVDRQTFVIDEGARFTLGDVRGTVRVKSGDVFSRRAIADDREAVSTRYQDQGYAFVEVLPQTHIDVARRRVDLRFDITPGPRTRIEHVTIRGNERTPEAAIRRVLGIAPGQLYSQTAVVTSKLRVMGLGFHTVDVATLRGSGDGLIDVVFEVTE